MISYRVHYSDDLSGSGLIRTNNNESIIAASHTLLMENQKWPVEDLHRGPVLREAFPCHDGILPHWLLRIQGLLGWGLLRLRSLISPLMKRFILQNILVGSLNHFYIWQVTLQLGYGDTCWICTWCSMDNQYFTMTINRENSEWRKMV